MMPVRVVRRASEAVPDDRPVHVPRRPRTVGRLNLGAEVIRAVPPRAAAGRERGVRLPEDQIAGRHAAEDARARASRGDDVPNLEDGPRARAGTCRSDPGTRRSGESTVTFRHRSNGDPTGTRIGVMLFTVELLICEMESTPVPLSSAQKPRPRPRCRPPRSILVEQPEPQPIRDPVPAQPQGQRPVFCASPTSRGAWARSRVALSRGAPAAPPLV